MKNTKRILLVLSVVLAFAAMFAVAAFAEIGKVCLEVPDNDLWWNFDEATGVLTITGTSEDFSIVPAPNWDAWGNIPWSSVRTMVKKVVVEAPIKTLCTYAFAYLVECETIVLPDNDITISGACTFAGCYKLKTLGPEGTPEGVIDLRRFKGQAQNMFEDAMQNQNVTVLFPEEGTPCVKNTRPFYDTTTMVIRVAAGSAGETLAKLFKLSTANDFIPDKLYVEYYNGTEQDTLPADFSNLGSNDSEDTGDSGNEGNTPVIDVLAEGNFSEDLKWKMTTDGVLTIYGTGTVLGFWNGQEYEGVTHDTFEKLPWRAGGFFDIIKEVVITAPITEVKSCMLGALKATKITIPATLKTIGYEAFLYSSYINTVVVDGREAIPGVIDFTNITYIEPNFFHCYGHNANIEIRLGANTDFAPANVGYATMTAKIVAYEGTNTVAWLQAGNFADANITYELLKSDGTNVPSTDTTAPKDDENPTPAGDNVLYSGSFYSDLHWKVTADKVLTIYGTGTELGYMNADGTFSGCEDIQTLPWMATRDAGDNKITNVLIQEVVVEAPITVAHKHMLSCFGLATKMTIPATLTTLGAEAFLYNSKLNTVVVEGNAVAQGVIDLRNITSIDKSTFSSAFGAATVLFGAGLTDFPVNEWSGYGAINIVAYEGSAVAAWLANADNYSNEAKFPNAITYKLLAQGEEFDLPEADETTSSAPETTSSPETTTNAPEGDDTTTAPGTDSTTAPESSTQTGDVNFVMIIAFAVAALGSAVVLFRKKRFN